MPFKVKLFHKYNLFQFSRICNNLCILLIMHLRLKPDHRVKKARMSARDTETRQSPRLFLQKVGRGP